MIKIKRLRLIFLLTLALNFFPSIQASTLPAQNQDMPKQILKYINQYRVEHRLSPLEMNSFISTEAKQHSKNMAQNKMPFGHQDFSNRIHRVYQQVERCNGGAENVAYAYKNAKEVVEQWLTSPGHRKNIQGHYNLTGIGVARDTKGKIYYTQIFIRTV